ncbi:type VI secretion system baseplate subunit TssG [Photobacterium sp. BZF1]|uniref:type VI secretion system baseplate subunit TssG n=1 Tax=Photobacterium sp. BZF1 TaxID=1904457 RepID=UPI00210537FF|nr:type VI secretion system baseplate subunit TssG [Photobacterium sp. BZF1]
MSVASRLLSQPQQFDFIQAVRILNTISSAKGMDLELSADPMPKGAPSDVTAIKHSQDKITLSLGLEALSGCKGVIPDYLYAEMLQSLHQDDRALQAFLDVFNQRYFELRASLECSGNLLLRDERETVLAAHSSRLSQQAALANLFSLPDMKGNASEQSTLRYGLLLGNKSRSLSGLKELLCSYFSLDVSPRVLPSELYRIRPTHQTKIGSQQGQNHLLGQGVVLGSKGEQAFKSIEIYITPQTKAEYKSLLKNTRLALAMTQLVRAYLKDNTEPKIYLYVKREYIDPPVLSMGKQSVRLGEANCLAPERNSSHFRKILLLPENNV